MATEIVSTLVFFPVKKLFLLNKNLSKFQKMFAQSLHSAYLLNMVQVSFHVLV